MPKLCLATLALAATMGVTSYPAAANCWSVRSKFIEQGRNKVTEVCIGEGKINVDYRMVFPK